MFQEICSMLGTTVKHSTAKTPHSHGDVEQQNLFINYVLRTLSQDQIPDLLAQWDEHVKLNEQYWLSHPGGELIVWFGSLTHSAGGEIQPDHVLHVGPIKNEVITCKVCWTP